MLKNVMLFALIMSTFVVNAHAQETFSRRKAGQPVWDYHQSSLDYEMPYYTGYGYEYEMPPMPQPYMEYDSPYRDNIQPHRPYSSKSKKIQKKQIDKRSLAPYN